MTDLTFASRLHQRAQLPLRGPSQRIHHGTNQSWHQSLSRSVLHPLHEGGSPLLLRSPREPVLAARRGRQDKDLHDSVQARRLYDSKRVTNDTEHIVQTHGELHQT